MPGGLLRLCARKAPSMWVQLGLLLNAWGNHGLVHGHLPRACSSLMSMNQACIDSSLAQAYCPALSMQAWLSCKYFCRARIEQLEEGYASTTARMRIISRGPEDVALARPQAVMQVPNCMSGGFFALQCLAHHL